MLFFELFPLFMLLVSLLAGVALYAANLSARQEAESGEDGEPD